MTNCLEIVDHKFRRTRIFVPDFGESINIVLQPQVVFQNGIFDRVQFQLDNKIFEQTKTVKHTIVHGGIYSRVGVYFRQ